MSLGERCDEILRLIDETLTGLGIESTPAPVLEPVLADTAERRRRRPTRTPVA